MSNKCSHAICFPKNMLLELGKIIIKKKRHFTTLHGRLFLIFVFNKKVMRQGKKAKARIEFFTNFISIFGMDFFLQFNHSFRQRKSGFSVFYSMVRRRQQPASRSAQ